MKYFINALFFVFLIGITKFVIAQAQSPVFLLCKNKQNTESNSKFSIPYLKESKLIKNNAPFFNIQSTDNDTKATGWMGVNETGIFLRVEVYDKFHINVHSGAQIWDGDALQIGIDANGDGTNGGTKDEIYIGTNDAMYALGLNGDSAISWAHYHGNSTKNGGNTTINSVITRDEKNYITTYSIYFPWIEFNWDYGLSDYIGISVMINDLDTGKALTKLQYERGVGSKLQPGLFGLGKIYAANQEFYSMIISKSNIWTEWDNAKILIATNSSQQTNIHLYSTKKDTVFEIPASKNNTINRFTLLVKPFFEQDDSVSIKINWEIKTNSKLEKNYTIFNKAALIDTFRILINKRILAAGNEFEKKHLLSLSAIIEEEFQQALINLEINPKIIEEWALYANQINNYLRQMVDLGSSIISGQTAMICAFKSSSDNSLQLYRLQFPLNYTIGKQYPLIVDLHGSGNPYVLSFLGNYQEHGIQNHESKNPLETFILSPWGRGNQAYLGYSGQDIYDGINDVKRNFEINNKKIYLTGFSMGGWGTWYHGLKSPDYWAAIAPCAGSIARDSKLSQFAINLKNTPVLIWHGINDGSVTDSKLMYNELVKVNNQPEIRFIENRGHEFRNEDRIEIYKWLLSQNDKQLDSFTYLIRDNSFNNIYGITVKDFDIFSGIPKINLAVKNQTINIETVNIKSMSINLDKLNLNKGVEYEVYWNGSIVYKGFPIKEVFLNKE